MCLLSHRKIRTEAQKPWTTVRSLFNKGFVVDLNYQLLPQIFTLNLPSISHRVVTIEPLPSQGHESMIHADSYNLPNRPDICSRNETPGAGAVPLATLTNCIHSPPLHPSPRESKSTSSVWIRLAVLAVHLLTTRWSFISVSLTRLMSPEWEL